MHSLDSCQPSTKLAEGLAVLVDRQLAPITGHGGSPARRLPRTTPMLAGHPRTTPHPLTRAGRTTLALLLAVAALANLATLLLASPWQQAVAVEHVVDLDRLGWGREGTLAVGVLLLVVARALARGKRHAWFLAVALLAFSLVSAAIARVHLSYAPLMQGLLV